jgi:serine/threonine-protein kinase
LIRVLQRHALLTPGQLDTLTKDLLAMFPDPQVLVRQVVMLGWLTSYQVEQLCLGNHRDLVLGRYVLLERLARGGMGQVFKARHRHLGRIVAVKVMRTGRPVNPVSVRRFLREVRALARLKHPNVVSVYDAGQADGTHFFVMEYVEGIDLGELVQRTGPLLVEEACDYLRQAALGLQHVHEAGLVHRDIKPSNLLLTGGSQIKLLDLGLVRVEGDDSLSVLTHQGMVLGTPDFIAPEQVMDSHQVDIRADLYSLGCTGYFLLTGQVPFPGGTPFDKATSHRSVEPQPVEQLQPSVPAAVGAVVRRLMAKRPEDRYQTPAEAAAALTALLELDREPNAANAAETLPEGTERPVRPTPQPAARNARSAHHVPTSGKLCGDDPPSTKKFPCLSA